jgi:hypothetical protein
LNSRSLFSLAARRILMKELGGERSSDQMARIVTMVYGKFLVHLSALLGAEGGLALFRYSLRRAQAAFPFYAEIVAVQPQTTLKALAACLEKQIPACLLDASTALLTTFLELLATFIGERLTGKLLCEVWPDLGPVSQEMQK